MADAAELTLVEAAEAVRAGRISARELAEACLARIERLQPTLNAFISVDAEGALAAADAADAARARGEGLGPLHGVPLAHKDMYYRAGKISTCGAKIRKEFRPDYTATAIERLERAGALHLGGLNMSEFAFGPTGHNAHFGPARNPWNPEHVTGGSSSGSGSAVAGRLAYGALGSETGGSIRLPAAFCGLAGIKPTQGRVSRYGAMGLSFSLDCVGPLARTVRDCARLLAVVAGRDDNDPTSSTMPVPDYEAATVGAEVRGLRVGVPKSYYYEGVAEEVNSLLQASLRRLSELGAEIVEVDIPDQDRLSDLMNVVMGPEAATLHGAWLKERPEDYGAQVRARIEPGLAVPATWYLHALQIRPEMTRRFVEAAFGRCDVLHAPVLNMPVPTIAETDVKDSAEFPTVLARMTRCTRPINYLGLPSLSVPAGFTGNGLPTAFQLIGPPFAEALLFRIGAAYEAATEWTKRAPRI